MAQPNLAKAERKEDNRPERLSFNDVTHINLPILFEKSAEPFEKHLKLKDVLSRDRNAYLPFPMTFFLEIC